MKPEALFLSFSRKTLIENKIHSLHYGSSFFSTQDPVAADLHHRAGHDLHRWRRPPLKAVGVRIAVFSFNFPRARTLPQSHLVLQTRFTLSQASHATRATDDGANRCQKRHRWMWKWWWRNLVFVLRGKNGGGVKMKGWVDYEGWWNAVCEYCFRVMFYFLFLCTWRES